MALRMGLVPIPLAGKVPLKPQWEQTTAEGAMSHIRRYLRQGLVSNIGVLTGASSGIVVFDIDPDGTALWQSLIQQYGEPQTLKVLTPRGGFHYYFNYDGGALRTTNKIAQTGLDFRSDGGQVVFPFGSSSEGRPYQIVNGCRRAGGEYEFQLLGMPAWLDQFIRERSARTYA